MDWAWFNTPLGLAIVPPAGAFLGALVGVGIASWTARATHRERLRADRDLAERKFKADIDLAERRFTFDRKLAEDKIRLDIEHKRRQRQTEVAEVVVARIYAMRDIYIDARSPLVRAGEMIPQDGEPEDVKDAGYAPIARLGRNREAVSKFWVTEYEFAALFGESAREPFHKFRQVDHRIRIAVDTLLFLKDNDRDQSTRDLLVKCRRDAFSSLANEDEILAEMNAAVAQVGEICRDAVQYSSCSRIDSSLTPP